MKRDNVSLLPKSNSCVETASRLLPLGMTSDFWRERIMSTSILSLSKLRFEYSDVFKCFLNRVCLIRREYQTGGQVLLQKTFDDWEPGCKIGCNNGNCNRVICQIYQTH